MVCLIFTGGGLDNFSPDGHYKYTGDLLELERCVPSEPKVIPHTLLSVVTPLKRLAWVKELHSHPDREFIDFILRGLENGFRIGFSYSKHVCVGAKRNMLSASQHPEPIVAYISKERRAGRIIGPFPVGMEGVQVSRFGVIPKPHKPGEWQLITDLSSPKGNSVNDGIRPDLCSLSYASVDDAVAVIQRLDLGAVLAKFDLEAAYRIVPIHPQDRLLLGMVWQGELFVDEALPFGLRSAPKIFNALADGLIWILGQHGIRFAIHYLDDFLLLGPPDCHHTLTTSLHLCEELGVPIAPHKLEGPSTEITFLGIHIPAQEGLY